MAETWQEELIRDGTLRRDGLQDIFNNQKLSDRDVAFDLLMSSKAGIYSLARAITETSNPGLRQILLNNMNLAAQEHFQLADLVANRDWYRPYAAPAEQLGADAKAAQKLNGTQQNATGLQ